MRGADGVDEQEGIRPAQEASASGSGSGRPPADFGLFQAKSAGQRCSRRNTARQSTRPAVMTLGWRRHHADPSVPPREMQAR